MTDAQVIIVGGGPAGLSTALFLLHARPGLEGNIVVLEKARYPREKPCAGAIGGRADDILQSIGVSVDVPSVLVGGMSVVTTLGRAGHSVPAIGRVVRRLEFDQRLAQIAAERGATIIEDAKAESLTLTDDEVVVETTKGAFRGRVLVGADGVGSVVRRHLGLSFGRYRAQVLEIDTEQVEGDPDRSTLHFDLSDPSLVGYAWDFPTVVNGQDLYCRGIYEVAGVSGASGSNIPLHERFAERLRRQGLRLSDYKQKRFGERGFERHIPFAAPRVVLIGEAAGIDPLTGEGIAQAIEYGQTTAEYLLPRLSSGDLTFADWQEHLTKSRVGFDLGIRARLVELCLGPRRRVMEEYLVNTPSLLDAALKGWGGKRIGFATFFRLGLSAIPLAVRLASHRQAALSAGASKTLLPERGARQ